MKKAIVLGVIMTVALTNNVYAGAGVNESIAKSLREYLTYNEVIERRLTIEDDTAYIYLGYDLVETYDSYYLLCACVEAEAEGETLDGKRLVADVILNRVDSAIYPDTVGGVISQPYQFTPYWDGRINSVSVSEETEKAVQMELLERGYPSLIYFRAGRYSDYGTPWRKVGNHYFSTF